LDGIRENKMIKGLLIFGFNFLLSVHMDRMVRN
jgi:hypothetical protein